MKIFRNKIKYLLFAGALTTGIFASCSNGVEEKTYQKETIEVTENKDVGNASFSIFVPDYDALAKSYSSSARVIASQTNKIKFYYYNSSTSAWVLHTTVSLDSLEKTYIEATENTIAGSIYNVKFEKIPSGTYSAGTLKVELVNSTDSVLTSGYNDADVGILMGETTTASFYTLPENVSNDVATLSAGEMKFYKWYVAAGKTYTIKVSVSDDDTVYPDIVIFDKSGKFVSYHSVDSASEASITLNEETENTYRYIAVFADEGVNINCYTLTFSSTGTIQGAIDTTEFNETGFGTDSIASSFNIATTASSSYASYVKPSLVDLEGDYNSDGKAIEFAYKYLRTSTASLTRTIVVNEDSVISFAYKTDITSDYDGTLNFYIDGEQQDSYTGMNGSWTVASFYLSEGEHTVEWRAVGVASSYTGGITNTVYLDALSIGTAPEPDYTLQNGFGNSSNFSYDWTISGDEKPTLEADADKAGTGYAVCFNYQNLGEDTSSLSRTIRVAEDSLITFKYKTDITSNYDGVMNFYIDEVLQESSWTGQNGSWTQVQFLVETGSHTVEWRSVGVSSSYTSGITWTVYLCDLSLSSAPEAPSTLTQDFGSDLDTSLWLAGGVSSEVSTDEIFESWAQYGDALVDTHEKVYALKTYDGTTRGNSTLKIFYVKPTVDSALSFEYKLDLYTADYLKVYVDGEEKFSETGYGQTWKTASIDISAGTHTITFSAEKTNNYYSTTQKNAVYIDNVTLVADTTESVDISPKGKQETYVGGFDIQFTANALRSDGSTRSDRTVSWTATGGSIDENGLFTPGSTSGTYTVTATIDGKTASNTTVIVHGEDYLEDSVTIGGETFTGYSGTIGVKSTGTVTFTKAPTASSFSADGFFVLKGTVSNSSASNYAMVKIESGDDETFVLLKDSFYTRVWLRFGTENIYTVTVYDMTSISFSGECYMGGGLTTANSITYNITNTHSLDNADQLMPSYYCQGDDFLVSNAVNAVLAELPSDATVGQKLQALHDWEIHRMHYDNVSLNSSSRKLQDAVSVVKNEMGVCEGYANLYAALARSIGVRTKYQASSSMNHGWVQCYYNDEWKLLDATWDDPVSSNSDSNTEKNPYAENYKYFLIGTTGVSNDHYSDSTDNGRAAISVRKGEYRPFALPGSY